MIIDVYNMFNYQITCNESSSVGLIHSYVESILDESKMSLKIKLNRKNYKKAYIVRVA